MPFDLSDEQLTSTESDIGAVFPETYRLRMKEDNGGAIFAKSDYWNLIPIRDTSDRKRVSRTANHVLVETESFSGFPHWHDNALAIAENGAGDALVMFQQGVQISHQVFYWSHEDGRLELIADDFSKLANDR